MELGRLTAIFDADTRKFDAGARGVATKVAGLTTDFNALRGGAGSAAAALSGLASPMALVAGGAVVAATAISSVAVGLFTLVKSSAEAGGELLDLSQKTAFTVETLSGLSIVAKTTGSDIQSLSGSLIIFQKNMEAANDVSSKQGKLFQSLSIDTKDNEKAIRQAFAALNKMGESARQTATATQLFGRSGAAVLAIIKETNGDLDEAIKKYDEMGLIITHGAAAASDRFNDVLEETTLQLAAVTRSIGMELLPTATDALEQISFWLAQNKGAWSSWGTTINNIVSGVGVVMNSWVGSMIGDLARLSAELTMLPQIARQLGQLGSQAAPNAAQARQGAISWSDSMAAKMGRLQGLNNSRGVSRAGGGGGRGGGGGSARQDPGVQLLKQLEQEYQSLIPKTEAQAAAEKLLGSEYAKTSDTIKKKIQITAMEIDQQRMISGITRERVVGLKAETEALEKMIDMIREAGDRGLPFFSRQRTTMDLTGLLGTEGTRKRSIADGATRSRVATVDEQVNRERLAMIREQMESLAADLMGIFDRALYDGIAGGGMRGLQSLTIGFLQMIQDVIMGQLKKALAEALGGIVGGTNSGSILGKILSTVFGVAVGAATGGGGAGIPGIKNMANPFMRANGGPVAAGLPYMVHKDEMIVPTQNGMVFNKQQQARLGGGTTVNHFNITVPRTHQSAKQRRSQRELVERMAALVSV